MSDRTEIDPQNPQNSPWLLGPADLAAVRTDDALLDALTCGEVPEPPDDEPRSVRPPFAERDESFDPLRATDPDGWRRAVHLDRMAALLEPLAGIALSAREHAIVEWLAGWDVSTVAPVVRLLWAARAAAPLTESGGVTR
jgi:hypothetical protein